jgi:hypothetical protein
VFKVLAKTFSVLEVFASNMQNMSLMSKHKKESYFEIKITKKISSLNTSLLCMNN